MNYINYRFNNENETVDSADTYKEALCLLTEYEISDPYGEYWISKRKCKYPL
tara:strand:- start:445 stop:600 length:156 start_codon:yes stop_codon:yes gene_type:complete